jgi:hypothetical protein
MTVEAADRALASLGADRDRIGTSLLALRDHLGYKLLTGGTLDGKTEERRAALSGRITELWELFDAYRSTLDRAADLRARNDPPGQQELAALTALLTEESIEPAVQKVELSGGLLGTGPQRLTLRAAVSRMSEAYDEIVALVTAADALWEVLLPRLTALEESWRVIGGLREDLGASDHGPAQQLGRRLEQVRTRVQRDPFFFRPTADLPADLHELDELAEHLTQLRAELEQAQALREDSTARIAAITAAVADATRAEEEVRRVREEVAQKIAGARLGEPPVGAAALEQALVELTGQSGARLREAGDWASLGRILADLEQRTKTARQAAEDDKSAVGGLLDRRNELRGRLDAYGAKAGRLGLAEDLHLAGLQQHARQLLWTAPCDLKDATAALTAFREAIADSEVRLGTAPPPQDAPEGRLP